MLRLPRVSYQLAFTWRKTGFLNRYAAPGESSIPMDWLSRRSAAATMYAMIFLSNKSRPYHFGPYPLERLERNPDMIGSEQRRERTHRLPQRDAVGEGFCATLEKYRLIFHSLRDDQPAARKAPVPGDLKRRMIDIKGSAYFLNASQVGICDLTDSCWLEGATPRDHSHAVVVMVEHGRAPENGTLANAWIEDSIAQAASFRAYEIAISIANQVETFGVPGRIQVTEKTYGILAPDYEFQERGRFYVKGIGDVGTYLLSGRRPDR